MPILPVRYWRTVKSKFLKYLHRHMTRLSLVIDGSDISELVWGGMTPVRLPESKEKTGKSILA